MYETPPKPPTASAGHTHQNTYEQSLPPEALGARQLVEYLYTPDVPGKPASALSPPDAVMRPKKTEVGMPLPLSGEPVNPQTGKRLVYLARGEEPVAVVGEPRSRFLAISFRPTDGTRNSTGGSGGSNSAPPTYYGTLLGYSSDDTAIVWHERSVRFARVVPLSSILTIHRASALMCLHCGNVLLRPELREHMATHKKGSGVDYGVFTGDSVLGRACGDTGLIQRLTNPRRLGEGAQGVVDLFEVIQPSASELAAAGADNHAFQFTSEHTSPSHKLKQVVVKTMKLPESEAEAEYQKSVRFMTVMQHPHLVEYLAVQLMPDMRTLRLVMPHYSEGDVETMIRNFQGSRLEESVVCSIGLQLSLGLAFLHERNPPIVHGDIKLENVMFYNNHEQVVLMDMDASCEVKGYAAAVESSVGTTAYMAPETICCERLMPASDMWSLGVFLYVLTVLPDFPMITHPGTHELVLLNATEWATADDMRGIEAYADKTGSTVRGRGMRLNSGMTLGECVRQNVQRRGYSDGLTNIIVSLLSYNPFNRPAASTVVESLTDVMAASLLLL